MFSLRSNSIAVSKLTAGGSFIKCLDKSKEKQYSSRPSGRSAPTGDKHKGVCNQGGGWSDFSLRRS